MGGEKALPVLNDGGCLGEESSSPWSCKTRICPTSRCVLLLFVLLVGFHQLSRGTLQPFVADLWHWCVGFFFESAQMCNKTSSLFDLL